MSLAPDDRYNTQPSTRLNHQPTDYQTAPTLQRYNDRYQVIRSLGEGGFSRTFLVYDEKTQQQCVLKQLKFHSDPRSYAIIKRGFDREVKILKQLQHSQIPALYDCFHEDDQFYLVQEYIEGETLQEKLRSAQKFGEEAVRQFLIEILPILKYIHSCDIIHRDIKPANIILRRSDGKPVLIDFGAVKEVMSSIFVSYGQDGDATKIGTIAYMAPEQFAGKPVTASDIYSLGKTAIQMLTGLPPDTDDFQSSQLLKAQKPAISKYFITVLNKAVKFELHDRFTTADEMLAAVTMETIVPDATDIPSTIKILPERRFSRKLVGLSAAAATILGVASFGFRSYQETQSLAQIRSLYSVGNFEMCIQQANAFSSFLAGRSNVAKELLSQCSLRQQSVLETYLQETVPQQEEDSDHATILKQLMPTVQINGEEVIIHYNADNSKLSTEQTLKRLTAIYMESLRGNPKTEKLHKQYAGFNRLIVSPKSSTQQAVLYVDQWNQYVEDKISKAMLFDEIQLINKQEVSP